MNLETLGLMYMAIINKTRWRNSMEMRACVGGFFPGKWQSGIWVLQGWNAISQIGLAIARINIE
ncbi:hypothetical protein DERP_006691 [Dermatophagoides pteronyssinus]|uniref:Uncharacterized protein n=1 Tax=Dermatophagoides pteronyssinus TaxID=6956 RepID=A0ABQ8IQY4_DERPT|nr:hypothetical protein DERP_006691 [Dermatophagoides pteronyssinus]